MPPWSVELPFMGRALGCLMLSMYCITVIDCSQAISSQRARTVETAVSVLENSVPTTPIAVFDLDGTLLSRDTFLPFVIGYAWKHGFVKRLWHSAPYLVGRAVRLLSAERAKEGVLRMMFSGERREKIATYAEVFCQSWVAHKLRPQLERRLREHLQTGHRVLLVSASPDLYVATFARLLDIPEVVCTRIAFTSGLCTGRLASRNCKGPEKLRMLKEHLGFESAPRDSVAYGDSYNDLPVLLWATRGFLVRRWSGRIVLYSQSSTIPPRVPASSQETKGHDKADKS